MKIESINQSVRERPGWTLRGVDAAGGFIALDYVEIVPAVEGTPIGNPKLLTVYLNNDGKEVLAVQEE